MGFQPSQRATLDNDVPEVCTISGTYNAMNCRRISAPNSPGCLSNPIIPSCPHTGYDQNDAAIHVCNRPNVTISASTGQYISAHLITPAASPTRPR